MSNKYSEWIIIPKDRKCDLPYNAKVQVMWNDQTRQAVERSDETTKVFSCCDDNEKWYPEIFAYRVVQEPVEEVREYPCNARFYKELTPSFIHNSDDYHTTKGTATQTTRDGKPYEFIWRASE